jgi:hypothetical protein
LQFHPLATKFHKSRPFSLPQNVMHVPVPEPEPVCGQPSVDAEEVPNLLHSLCFLPPYRSWPLSRFEGSGSAGAWSFLLPAEIKQKARFRSSNNNTDKSVPRPRMY